VAFNFSASGLQAITDESWGLDNVRMELFNQTQGSLQSLAFLSAPPPLRAGNPVVFEIALIGIFTNGVTLDVSHVSDVAYASGDTNVFTVNAVGQISPRNGGSASLVATYLGLSATTSVTVLAPVALRQNAPAMLSAGGAPVVASLFADFPGTNNLDITGFTGVTRSSSNPTVATMANNGTLTPREPGSVMLTAIFQGLTNQVPLDVALPPGFQPGALIHRYSFNEPPNTTVVSDSVGSANGQVINLVSGAPTNNFNGAGQLDLAGGAGGNVSAAYVNLPNGLVSGRQSVSFEGWVTWNGPATSTWQRLFDFGRNTAVNVFGDFIEDQFASTGVGYLYLTPRASSARPRFGIKQSTGFETPDLDGTAALPVGIATHFAVVYDQPSGVARLYINGQRVATAAATFPLSVIEDRNVWLGRSQFSADPFLNGLFDEFRIYNGALLDSDVAASYAAGPENFNGQTAPRPNDHFQDATTISGAVVSTFGSTLGATKDPGEPEHAGNPGGHSVWWNWKATTNSLATVDTIGSSFNTLLAVYTGTVVSNLVVVASDDDGGTNETSRLTFSGVAGTEYHIAVDGYNGAVGGIVLNVQALVPPQIVVQPKSRTISAGYASIMNFGVSALGAGPLSYQWWKDGSPIPLATNPTLSVTSVSATNNFPSNNTNAGLYAVAVSNAFGVAFSSNAALSVEAYVVTRWAGITASPGDTDGMWDTAQFREPDAIAVDAVGNLYVADAVSHVIRKITPDRVVSTLAGLAGTPGSADGVGSDARFNQPDRLAVDNLGNVYVSDQGNQTIRKITPNGVVSTLAGLAGNAGSADGSGSNARFNGPEGIAVDTAGNVYVGDLGNRLVRKITPAGVVTTLAGLAGASGSGDGQGSNARFVFPNGVAVDDTGNVYVADGQGGHTIRKISPEGLVTTLAGLGGSSGTANGSGSNARFTNPDNLAVDSAGVVYVAEFGGQTIRKITPDGFVTTLAGIGTASGSADGMGVNARFLNPNGVAVDSTGNLYIADRGNRTIRKVEPSTGIQIQQQPMSVVKSVNGTVDMSVQATGRGPFSYQWYFNGSPLNGANLAVLHLANLTFAQSGSYQVRIQTSDGFETVWSDPVTLLVTPYLTWTGAVSSDWSYPTNWNPPKVPAFSDRVVINSGSIIIPVNSAFDIMDWTGGSISGSLNISNNSVLNINGNVTLQCALTNAGTVNWLSGGIQISNNPAGSLIPVVNLAGGLWNIQCDQNLYPEFPYSNTYFANAGTVKKTAGTGATTLAIPFDNFGTVDGEGGTLTFGDGLFLDSSSVLNFPIGGATPGIGYGRLALNGIVDLAGRLEVSLAAGFVPVVGEIFPIFTWAGYTNGFAQENGLDLGDGVYFQAHIASGGLNLQVGDSGATTPALVTNLMDQVQAVGSTATFAFSPPGVGPFTYQWQFNGTNLPGQNGATLMLTNVQADDAGTYCVVVVDALMVTNVYCATLDALIAPSIAIPPASQTVTIGSTVTFSVMADGTEPFAYQWRLNGASLPGATNATYSITNVQPTDVGRYSVVVQNEAGAVASPDAELNVISPTLPFADDFDVAGSIGGFSGVGSGNNTNATRETGEPMPAGKQGNRTVWLRWTAPANGVVTFDTRGSSFDTLLGVYTGTNVVQLNPMASDDDDGGFFTSSLLLNVEAGTDYNIAVEGLDDASGDIVLSWNLNTNVPPVPKILQQPADLTVPFGWPATFLVVAGSTENLTYQWLFNDVPIAGATNDVLTVWNIGPGNVGYYRVVVMSAEGQQARSLAASLEIGTDATSHSYDKLDDLLDSLGGIQNPHFKGSSAFPSVSVGTIGSQIINNFNSTTQQGEPVHSSVIGGSSRWYLLTATTNATMEIDTLGSDIATVLAVYIGKDIFSLRTVATNVNGASDGLHSMVMFPATNGTAYLVAVDGVKGAQGNIYVNWRMGIPPNPVGPPQMLALVDGAGLSLQSGVTNNVTTPTYQWQVNGVNIAGATNNSFTLSTIKFDQVGSYGVVVRNLLGQVVNSIATVSAQTPLRLAPGYSGFQLSGSATQAVVLQLSTNLTFWTPVFTNPSPLLPIIYSDPVKHPKAFYTTKPWP
jgi:sugar lactone lactonase YvrE